MQGYTSGYHCSCSYYTLFLFQDSSQDQASSRCDSPVDKPLSNDEDERESPPAPKRHSLIDSIPILSPLNESPNSRAHPPPAWQRALPSSRPETALALKGAPRPSPTSLRETRAPNWTLRGAHRSIRRRNKAELTHLLWKRWSRPARV